MHHPEFEHFLALARRSSVVPIYRRLISDTLTPVSAFLRLNTQESSFLFESVVGGEKVGRYSFVGSEPFLHFEAYGSDVRVTGNSVVAGPKRGADEAADPLEQLGTLLKRFRAEHVSGLPRFCGGAVGYIGYDAVRYTERLPNAPPDDRGLPDLAFDFYDSMVIFDHIQKTV